MEPDSPQNPQGTIARAGQRMGQRADRAAMQATEGLAQAGGSAGGILDKFNALPTAGKAVVVLGVLAVIWVIFGGNGTTPQAPRGPANVGQVGGQQVSNSTTFGALESDRPALIQNVFEQNRRDMAELRTRMEEQFAQRDNALQSALQQNQELQQQMQQMMGDFTAEIKAMQESREQDASRLAQLADQQQQLELGAPVGDASAQSPIQARRRPIGQTSLGAPPLGAGGGGLLGPLAAGVGANLRNNVTPQNAKPDRKPFIPPLGFVEATLINGVDALVGSGGGTPALARISGNYTTAMNSTVYLDGCIVLIEFVGNISTERAVGKPARMTCVFPDGGAATYSLSGYVVDAEDGVIGVPGLLYEGDPTRIASSIVADFLAGVGEIIADNQTTTTTNSDGDSTQTLTGDDVKAEVAGGVNKAFSSIRDYLRERVDRATPFIRLDALRQVNLVLLSGQELHSQANPWTVLFDASKSEAAPAANTEAPATTDETQ